MATIRFGELFVVQDRPSLVSTFMAVAEVLSQRSTCDRGKVGAVIVNPNNLIVATGYNGALPGQPHCDHLSRNLGPDPHLGGNGRCINAEHAERNAIVHAGAATAAHGTLYSTVEPCVTCARMIVTAHIKKVIFKHAYNSQPPSERDYVVSLFRSSGIEYAQILEDGSRRRIARPENIL
jgi:dCMP deaminase